LASQNNEEKVSDIFLKEAVKDVRFNSVSSQFHAWNAATKITDLLPQSLYD